MSNLVCSITHLGTATIILEIGSLRLLTDPAFDPAGGKYSFGYGTGSKKLTAPSISAEAIGQIDAVLLSHDHHADNLDNSGRAFLPKVKQVVTTSSGAKRLRNNAVGLPVWQSIELKSKDGLQVRVTATPARHGPPLSRPLVGEVIGFILEWKGQQNGALYISGDTVWFSGIAEVGKRFPISLALLHLGGVRFPISGPLRYTFNGQEAVQAAKALNPKTIIPIHYEGWTHFHEPRKESEKAFIQAGLDNRVLWLPLGVKTTVEL